MMDFLEINKKKKRISKRFNLNGLYNFNSQNSKKRDLTKFQLKKFFCELDHYIKCFQHKSKYYTTPKHR